MAYRHPLYTHVKAGLSKQAGVTPIGSYSCGFPLHWYVIDGMVQNFNKQSNHSCLVCLQNPVPSSVAHKHGTKRLEGHRIHFLCGETVQDQLSVHRGHCCELCPAVWCSAGSVQVGKQQNRSAECDCALWCCVSVSHCMHAHNSTLTSLLRAW